jgi:hypothetical protein
LSDKIKTIALETFEQIDPEGGPPYKMRQAWRVMKVTDSIEFTPGAILLKPQVDQLCAATDWKVTITAKK